MKRLLIVMALVAGLCFFVAPAAMADETSEATSHVFVTVSPNITLSGQAHVDAGSVQTGDFTAECIFRVDANTQQIQIYAEASDLYKGNDPTAPEVAPIPLNISAPVGVYLVNGSPLGTAASELPYTTAAGDINGFPTLITSSLGLESSQNNHFSQEVTLTFTWNQDDPEKPMGEYSGFVKMAAMVLP